jgi:hypothetical protein
MRWASSGGSELFVCFEESSCLFKVEEVSVYGHLIFAGVFGDGDDIFNTMAPFSDGRNEKVDVYHAGKSTGFGSGQHLADKRTQRRGGG